MAYGLVHEALESTEDAVKEYEKETGTRKFAIFSVPKEKIISKKAFSHFAFRFEKAPRESESEA